MKITVNIKSYKFDARFYHKEKLHLCENKREYQII